MPRRVTSPCTGGLSRRMYAWTSYSQGFGCAKVRPCAVRGRGVVQVKVWRMGRWFLSASTQADSGKDLDPAG